MNTPHNSSFNESIKENETQEHNRASFIRRRLKSRNKMVSKRSVSVSTAAAIVTPTTTDIRQSRKRHRTVIPVVANVTAYEYYPPPVPHTVPYCEYRPVMRNFHIPTRPIYSMAYQPLPVPVLPPPHVVSRSMRPFRYAVMRPQFLAPIITRVVTEVPSVVMPRPIVPGAYGPAPSHMYQEISQYPINQSAEDSIHSVYEEAFEEIPEENIYDNEIPHETTYDGIPEEESVNDEVFEDVIQDQNDTHEVIEVDPLENYLLLPRHLFPTTRMHPIDPNLLIDVFCNFKDLDEHVPWILDLEFGVPRQAVTRPIPMYNVKLYSINCKNAPDAIHPGFESCSREFKNALLFYYDYIISSWYKGYIILSHDRSVENFQAWLHLPMQMLGMCWP